MYYSRNRWGARRRRHHPGTLSRSKVSGVALHWPATDTRYGTPADVRAALRGWQNYHMDTLGWSDIAYQVAFDQGGNRYSLRGLRRRSAANGSIGVNDTYGAILLVLGSGEEPSPKMIRAVRRWIKRHRRYFPHSTQIVGHGDIRPGGTECPGPQVRRHLTEGTFEP